MNQTHRTHEHKIDATHYPENVAQAAVDIIQPEMSKDDFVILTSSN